MKYKTHPYIEDYISLIETGKIIACKEQYQLIEMVRTKLSQDDVYIDNEKIERAIETKERYFYVEFPFQKFIDCFIYGVFYSDGSLVYDEFFIYMGRGNGKNGFMSPNLWYMTTPYHGVYRYNGENVATAEDQAETTFNDIYDMLESNKDKMRNHYTWTKERIISKKTRSTIRFRTSNAKTKDGLRPGVVVFDEIHAYEDYENINVYTSALGKVGSPRIFYLTTDGYIREKVLDDMKKEAAEVLVGQRPESSLFPFICKLDDPKEIDDPEMWPKANPSYYYLPALRKEIMKQYNKSKNNPEIRKELKTKRFNIPSQDTILPATDWENILKTNQDMPDLKGETCIGCLDYAETTDFVGMGLLFKKAGKYYFMHHSYICHKSLIKAPPKINIDEAVEKGWCTIIYENCVAPDTVAQWFVEQKKIYSIREVTADRYRAALMREAFGKVNIPLIPEFNGSISHNKIAPTLDHGFANHNFVFGDDKMMRWYTNNVYTERDKKGNKTYKKIEPVYRKTDGFFAFLAGMIRESNEPLTEAIKLKPGMIRVRNY